MIRTRHYIWCFLVIGLAGLIFYCVKSNRVFPSASIDLSVSRLQIAGLAAEWSNRLSYDPQGAITSTVFTFDDDAKTFLEYQLGAKRANELMGDKIPVWYWATRFCRPLKQEELNCWINPRGKLVAFEHVIENDRTIPSIKIEDARQLARGFIEKEGEVSLSDYKLIEEGSVTQPGRTDHHFTWEDTKQNFDGAKLRAHVYVSGNLITAYNHFLYVPEDWSRKFAKLRSFNEALADSATIFYVAIWAGAFFVFLWAFAAGAVRWRFCLAVAVLYAVMAIIDAINGLPSAVHEYNTSLPFSGFQLEFALDTMREGVSTFFQTLVLIGAGEAIYRQMKPKDVALEKSFSPTGLRSRKTLSNILIGLGVFGVHLGWVVAYYLLGRKFGFWSPLEVDNAEALSGFMPFFSAMQIGFSAGLTEELMYRVLGLAAFKKLVRYFWLANLLQAAAWAFMHSNYPQEPPFARGIELTVVGLIYGFVLRRFGLLACFLSHNLLDTFMGVTPLFTSSVVSLKVSAVVAIAPFAGLLLVALNLIRQHGFTNPETEEPTLLNESLVDTKPTTIVEVTQEVMPTGYIYKPLGTKVRAFLALFTICALGIELFLTFPVVGGTARLSIGRDQAIKIAREYLKKHGIKPEGLHTVTTLQKALDTEEMQYIFENGGEGKTEAMAQNPERPLWWQVRFFRPLVEEEYLITMDQTGKPVSFGLVKPETASGESPDKKEAQRRAEQFLTTEHPEVVPFQLDDISEVKRDARVDYTLRFSVPKYQIGAAKYRISVDCVGGVISGYDTSWVLPSTWVFNRSVKSVREQVCLVIFDVSSFLCLIAMLIWARGVLRSGAIRWRPALLIGISTGIFSIVKNFNDLPDFFAQYKTNTPLISYYIAQGVPQLVGAISSMAIMTVMAAFGLAALRLLLPNTSVSAILKSTFSPEGKAESKSHKNLWIDAVLIGYAAGFGDHALSMIAADLHSHISPVFSIAPLDAFSTYVNLFNPSLEALMDSIPRGIYFIFFTAALVGIYAKFLRRFSYYLLFGLVASLITVSSYKYWQDALVDFFVFAISYIVSWFIVVRLAKENLLAYFLAGAAGSLVGVLRILWHFGGNLYTDDCVALVVFLSAAAIYALLRSVGNETAATTEADSKV